jgi:hypothetical protein
VDTDRTGNVFSRVINTDKSNLLLTAFCLFAVISECKYESVRV